jgi:hypothetical protein
MTPRQGLALVAGIVLVGATFSAIQRRNARVVAQSERAQEAALDALVADAQARADAFDAALAAADPEATLLVSTLPPPEIDTARVRFTLAARLEGTYLDELLTARNGVNVRWPDRAGEPMRIWVQGSAAADFDPAFVQLVRDGVSAWDGLGLPFLFTFITDSARAEIVVTWVDRFSEMMSGRTLWQHDQHGWIVGGTIELALHQPDGRPLDGTSVAAIARHEVGHLIGLDHTADETSIMSPRVQVAELSEADRRTARLVYDLPPGRLPR